MKVVVALLAASCVYLGLGSTYAAEVSFVSGGLKINSSEVGESENSVVELGFGGRYLEMIDEESAVYYDAGISYRIFDGDTAPDNALGITLGLGSRFYGVRFSENVIPFLSAYGELKSSQSYNEAITTSYETFGLNYGMGLGLRFSFYEGMFFELATDVFKSSLWKRTKTTVGDAETVSSGVELFVSSDNPDAFSSINLSFGITL